jgi:hypothetical protein
MFLACTTSSVYIDISHERYIPRFQTTNYSAYKGKRVFLNSFTNNAKNTSVFYYFSPDSKIKYGQYAIVSYYWYCFYKAFNNIGMVTYKDTAPSDIPEFLFDFDYLNDQKINFNVIIKINLNVVYQKKYELSFPAPESENNFYLENRAYEMVDRIISEVLNDKNLVISL